MDSTLCEIIEEAVLFEMLLPGRCKVGQYLERVSAEKREKLQNLTAADIQNVRFDWIGEPTSRVRPSVFSCKVGKNVCCVF